MTRIWIAIVMIVLGVAAVRAMPVDQQIIIFGSQSSASGGGGGSCSNKLDFSQACNSQYLAMVH